MVKKTLASRWSLYKRGFTLIELLVVLGILGILAATLLAAINPIEQLNKANDASLEQVAGEFIGADARYYAANNTQPTGCTGTTVTLASLSTCYNNLIAAGELKSGFGNLNNLASLYINFPATGTPTACFTPASQSVQSNPNTKYNLSHNGSAGTTCISAGGGNTSKCDWCAQ